MFAPVEVKLLNGKNSATLIKVLIQITLSDASNPIEENESQVVEIITQISWNPFFLEELVQALQYSEVILGNHVFQENYKTFQDCPGNETALIFSSYDLLEIIIRCGSAQKRLRLKQMNTFQLVHRTGK